MARKPRWTEADIPSLDKKVAIVTGANSGLGLDTARALAEHGAYVVMACRNAQKAEKALESIMAKAPEAKVEIRILDLSDLASVKEFAESFKRNFERLDLLVNNAGVMALPYTKTKDGFEMQIGVNHLGHFALTGQLMELLDSTSRSRVVNVSSLAHQMGRINFDDLNSEKKYSKWLAYGQSKLANLLFTLELKNRLQTARSKTLALACHPGYSATNLQLAASQQKGSRVGEWLWSTVNSIAAQKSELGALPTLYACVSTHLDSGDFVGPDGMAEMWGYPKKVKAKKHAYDKEAAARLWKVSEELTGVSYLG